MSIRRPPMNHLHLEFEPHVVYVIWHDDEPLYVGMTSNWRQRATQHRRFFRDHGATHLDAWECADSWAEAYDIETATIRALDPWWNSQHSPRRARERAAWEAECGARAAAAEAEYRRRAHEAVALLPNLVRAS